MTAFSGLILAAIAPCVGGDTRVSDDPIRVSGPALLLEAPDDTTALFASCSYTRSRGTQLMLGYMHERMSDVADEQFVRLSDDNGRTWSEPLDESAAADGPHAAHPADPAPSGHLNPFAPERLPISLSRSRPEGMDPDVPQTYWTQTGMTYAVMRDDGRPLVPAQPLIARGQEFSATHPIAGLEIGRNQVYAVHRPLFLDRERVVVPLELSALDDTGAVYDPHGWDFSQVVVLVGTRRRGGYEWWSSAPLRVDAFTESTRGMSEPTLGKLADGSLIMLMRGSNSFRPELPGRKWISRSTDGGRTWTHPVQWTFEDGTSFYSPSSISHLRRHSNGRLYWFGNVCRENPDGNSPRHPLVAGEVDRRSGLLKQATLTVVADRSPEQSPAIQFSNFSLYEDRVTREFVLDVTHYHPSGKPNRRGTGEAWTGNVYRYRIALTPQ
ncbi:MAG: hypothetical protein FJX74_20925 [Armatimonadetes bacterium]|nr:hypothetical protein [Armatimonadota bacterium]